MKQKLVYQYFGNISFYKNIYDKRHVDFFPFEGYQKSAHLNRTTLSGANGLINLNIPLIGGREQRRPFADVRVSFAENWRTIHLRSIISSYKRSPWYDEFHDDLSVFYKNDFKLLHEWNRHSFEWMVKVLGLPVAWAERLKSGDDLLNAATSSSTAAKPGLANAEGHGLKSGGQTQRAGGSMAEFGGSQGGSEGQTGESHKAVPEPAKMVIEVNGNWKPYPQVFSDRFVFIPNLSILDLLFCLGPRPARNYIMGG